MNNVNQIGATTNVLIRRSCYAPKFIKCINLT